MKSRVFLTGDTPVLKQKKRLSDQNIEIVFFYNVFFWKKNMHATRAFPTLNSFEASKSGYWRALFGLETSFDVF